MDFVTAYDGLWICSKSIGYSDSEYLVEMKKKETEIFTSLIKKVSIRLKCLFYEFVTETNFFIE